MFAIWALLFCAAAREPSCEETVFVQTKKGPKKTFGSMAVDLACELAERIRTDFKPALEYFGDNHFVFNETYTELTMLCGERKEFERPTWNWMVNYSNKDFKCSQDVEGLRLRNPATNYYTSSLRWVSQKGFDFVVDTVAGSVPILGGAIKFLKNAFSWIWPTEAPKANPCANVIAEDWGKCVWQQILPFAQRFLTFKLEEAFDAFYGATIQGIRYSMGKIVKRAEDDSYHNGTFSPSPEVVETMQRDLHDLYKLMDSETPLFTLKTETAYAYLSQWASLHTSVMATLFSHKMHQDVGARRGFQNQLGCYAMGVFNRSVHSTYERLKGIYYLPHGHAEKCHSKSAICGPGGNGYKWCDIHVYSCRDSYERCSYKLDDFKGRDTWCFETPSCERVCDPFEGYHAYEMECANRRNNTRDQTYEFWHHHLAPIPNWLAMIIKMDKLSVPGESPILSFDCKALQHPHK